MANREHLWFLLNYNKEYWNEKILIDPNFIPDLSGANLSGKDLSNLNFSKGNLSNCDLKGANLESCVLSEVNLTGADLSPLRIKKKPSSYALSNVHIGQIEDDKETNLSFVNLTSVIGLQVDFSKIILFQTILPNGTLVSNRYN